jgi:oxygen-independent coproporphyrinogen-3 oxidase
MGNHEKTSAASVSVPEVVEQPCGLYPRLEAFSSDYGADDYCDWVDQSNGDPLPAPLVLYLQNETAQNPSSSAIRPGSPDQVRAIEQELRLQGALFDADRPLQQLIFSASIATGWSEDQLYRLVAVIQSSFFINQDSLNSWCACTAGLVPSAQRLRLLRVLGFNHVRLMPDEQLEQRSAERLTVAVDQARQLGFDKVILDLRRFADGSPDRLPLIDALLSDTQPERVRVFPCSGESHSSLDQRMASHGYQNIGLDWYLREEDRWWRAKGADRLYWTPLGYSELHNPDIIGVGPGALSAVCEFYGINAPSLQRYSVSLDEGILPIVQGTELENSDVLRREIIAMILASSCIRVSAIEKKWGIQFEHFFAGESAVLRTFEHNNWLRWQDDRIEIKTRAFRELGEICRVFAGRAGNSLNRARQPASTKSPEYSRTHLVP